MWCTGCVQAFSTCTVGVYLVGYTMMAYAFAGLLTALICSLIVKHVGINVLYAVGEVNFLHSNKCLQVSREG